MKCPTCTDQSLVMSDRQGVEIDYCPSCRGVWLDRGELDKIIDRSFVTSPSREPQRERDRDDHRDRDDDRGWHKKKKRESFLGELFDF